MVNLLKNKWYFLRGKFETPDLDNDFVKIGLIEPVDLAHNGMRYPGEYDVFK